MDREGAITLLAELELALETLRQEGNDAKSSTGYILLWRSVRNLEERIYRHPTI